MTPRRTVLGLLAGTALLLAPGAAFAQGNSKEVRFETIDKVKIKGTFYPSGGGNKSPCVLLLHKLGGNRQQDGWNELATALQNKGFAVLSFDFRGHNDSTSVDPDTFYSLAVNKRVFRPGKEPKSTISYKDFINHKKNYYYTPMLVYDVEAAKHFLDQQNNANECNSSNLVVIGADDGAAIGAVWLACQWKTPHYIPNPYGFGVAADPRRTAGDAVAAAVWLSAPVRSNGIAPGSFLSLTPIRDKVPMYFICGDKDGAGAKAAKLLYGSVKSPRNAETTKLHIKKGTKAAGNELLKRSLGTGDDIGNYLMKVMDKRVMQVWEKRVTPPQPQLLHLNTLGFAALP
jgi:predicted esterase